LDPPAALVRRVDCRSFASFSARSRWSTAYSSRESLPSLLASSSPRIELLGIPALVARDEAVAVAVEIVEAGVAAGVVRPRGTRQQDRQQHDRDAHLHVEVDLQAACRRPFGFG
jgi:hypothetical protein